MKYELRTTKQFEKDVHKLDRNIRVRLLKKVSELKTDPYSLGVLYRGGVCKGKL